MAQFSHFARTSCVAVALLALTSCSNLDDTQQRMVSGGAAGMALGTVGTLVTGGCIPCGTAIGGAVGVGTGYLLGTMDKHTKDGYSSSAPANYSSAPPPVSYSNAGGNYSSGGNGPVYTSSSSGY
ncbi:MAG: hypothetical protein WAO98_09085 [Alphaproteobacteria bacterium]